ncbi:Protein of unknown function [Bacillus cereus]|nr:Protein of unknown function [Bacillus mobilis]SCM91460.1 Protein of unknown function [Bacillus cereus]SCV23612.1 Protein of unknown function [Bacillus cereus]
MLLAVLTDY